MVIVLSRKISVNPHFKSFCKDKLLGQPFQTVVACQPNCWETGRALIKLKWLLPSTSLAFTGYKGNRMVLLPIMVRGWAIIDLLCNDIIFLRVMYFLCCCSLWLIAAMDDWTTQVKNHYIANTAEYIVSWFNYSRIPPCDTMHATVYLLLAATS